MYREAWRLQRDFFYDPASTDWTSPPPRKSTSRSSTASRSRADLNYLFNEMLGELTVGHMFVPAATRRSRRQVKGGLLGADYTVGGRYRFARVYNGENWNPELRAPLRNPASTSRPASTSWRSRAATYGRPTTCTLLSRQPRAGR